MRGDHARGGFGLAKGLCLAATPTFAVMAVVTEVMGGGRPEIYCAPMPGGSPLGGMAAMYLLMSAFHSAPWLRLMSRRRAGPDQAK
jgi:hypothetical protein